MYNQKAMHCGWKNLQNPNVNVKVKVKETVVTTDSQLYRIGEFAKKVGKTSRTLRFYEKLGLIFPQGRTESGYRLYSKDAFLQIQWVEQLQDLGFSLGDIKNFLEGLDQAQNRSEKMNRLRDFYEERLTETQAQLRKLLELENQLKVSLKTLDPCSRCDKDLSEYNCRSCLEETLQAQQRDKLPVVLEPVISRVLQEQ